MSCRTISNAPKIYVTGLVEERTREKNISGNNDLTLKTIVENAYTNRAKETSKWWMWQTCRLFYQSPSQCAWWKLAVEDKVLRSERHIVNRRLKIKNKSRLLRNNKRQWSNIFKVLKWVLYVMKCISKTQMRIFPQTDKWQNSLLEGNHLMPG